MGCENSDETEVERDTIRGESRRITEMLGVFVENYSISQPLGTQYVQYEFPRSPKHFPDKKFRAF